MRILHVISSLDPSVGGPPRVAVRLAAGQAALGHEVTLASTAVHEPDDFRAMTQKLPSFDQVRIAALPPGSFFTMLPGGALRRAMRPLVQASDVVHIHNVWDPANYSAAMEAIAANKPYLIQPNDMLNPWSLSQKRLKKATAMFLGYRNMIEQSYGLLFGHREERRLVQQAGFRTQHFVAPLGGVFQQEVEPVPEPGRFYSRVPGLEGRPFIVFLSRLHHKKGLDYLAEGFAVAAQRVSDAHLVVIGHDEGAQADFEQRIARHGLNDRVHLMGPMHGQAKWEAYRDAACFCLPSRDEAFTVAITEALAMGLPVVISENCHYDDVGEYEAGLIVKLDTPEALGGALTKVVSDVALRKLMSDNAIRLFREQLSFDMAARQALAIYEQSLGQPATARAQR